MKMVNKVPVTTKIAKTEKKISVWFDSGEFKYDIDSALTNIVRGAECAKTEADTANVFEREIYYLIRHRLGLKLTFEKECPVNGIVHSFGPLVERKSGRGRLDAVVNNVIIEYKHRSKLGTDRQRQQAIEQVRDYMKALDAAGKGQYSAILTDGVVVSYFEYVTGEVKNTSLRQLTAEDITMIIRAILNNLTKKFNPENIVRDFAISGNARSDSRELARSFYNGIVHTPTDKTRMLYEEWKGLMHLSVDDNGKSGDIEKRRRDLSLIFDAEIKDAENEYMALEKKPKDMDELLKLLEEMGYEIKKQKYISVRGNSQKTFIRFRSLGAGYRDDDLYRILSGEEKHVPDPKRKDRQSQNGI